jgi:hypothetical protein
MLGTVLILLASASGARCERQNAARRNIPRPAEAVTFENGTLTLAGTVYLPADSRRHAAVVPFTGRVMHLGAPAMVTSPGLFACVNCR